MIYSISIFALIVIQKIFIEQLIKCIKEKDYFFFLFFIVMIIFSTQTFILLIKRILC